MKKIYTGVGVLALVLVVGLGISWGFKKVAVSPSVSPLEQDVASEEESLAQDVNDLEGISQDTSLDALDEDLAGIAEEAAPTTPVSGAKKIETASIENLESELSLELSSFSTDLTDVGGFESDTSLGDLDTELSGI